MQLHYSLLHSTASSPASTSAPTLTTFSLIPLLRGFPRIRSSARERSPQLRPHLRVVRQSLGDRWKLRDLDADAVQERLSSWLLKARTLLTDVAAPLVKPGQGMLPNLGSEPEDTGIEEAFMASELTVNRWTPSGDLSLAAVISIEQFGRMIGLSGRKMQKIFEAQAPEPIRHDARSLVEYCCFRYLSRDSSVDIHPSLKEPAFQRLIFITMLAWEQPYSEDGHSHSSLESSSLQRRLIGEQAFVRIAPAIAGVADRSTVHHLFKALVGDGRGISLGLWTTYIAELCKVHEGRKSYHICGDGQLPIEQLLCIGSSRKRPVLKWEDNIAWPGNLTLTDHALYFEAIGLVGHKESIRLDLTRQGSRVEKTKVGPFRSRLFDSAVSVSSGHAAETWVLEFVDFGGEMRRDIWHAFISEVISLYEFIREYGPEDNDPSVRHVYGGHRGKSRAVRSAANSIARLQSLQFIRKLSEDPAKLVQFSFLRNVPYGDIVFQALAVNFWGGPMIKKFEQADHEPAQPLRPSDDIASSSIHVVDIDGSVYLRKWMRSPSWASSSSVFFWKNTSVRQGIVLGKNLVVADLNLVERAALTCKEKSQIVEKTQATIDAAMIKGIPSNIDLFKELMLPFVVIAKNFEKLRCWEEPRLTITFLAFAYTVIFRNLLSYVLPATFMIMASAMLLLKGLKEQGRLGRSFGKVTICDQPPSNTIQKIVALKEAMADLENYLQNLNVSLLKIRTIILSGQPEEAHQESKMDGKPALEYLTAHESTTEVALVLFSAATILLVVPFKYILSFVLLDLFTRELEFRRGMVTRFASFLKEHWASVHASPVVVLPYESDEPESSGEMLNQGSNRKNSERS